MCFRCRWLDSCGRLFCGLGLQFPERRGGRCDIFNTSNYHRELIIVLAENKFTARPRRNPQDSPEKFTFIIGRFLVVNELQNHDAVFNDRLLESEPDTDPPEPHDVEQLVRRSGNVAETVGQLRFEPHR